MEGLALPYSDVPVRLIEQHQMDRLVHDRGGEKEIRFMRQVRNAMLLIREDGQLKVLPWGCRNGKLPRSGFTWLSTVEAGNWGVYHARSVEIPAVFGLHNGVWFKIQQGIQGLVAEVDDTAAAYMIVEPSTYYYKIMTRATKMPVLIGERI